MASGGTEETVVVGRFLGPWGVQGWVRVYSWTNPPEALFDYQPWLLGPQGQPLEFKDWRKVGPRLVVQLATVDSPERAAELVDELIAVRRSALPPAEPGSYYWHDLVGLEVVNLDGYSWGRIEQMLPTGANDVMQISHAERGSVLIPFVQPDVVRAVDLQAGRVSVDWPEDWAD
jgi:16S rRNA processing protein RimM